MSADLALILASLGGGGAERVASLVANRWAGAGRRITLITLADADADFYELHPDIERKTVGGISNSTGFISALQANGGRIAGLRAAIKSSGAPTVLSFIAPTNVMTILACTGLGKRVIISERNDPARQSFGRMWDTLRRRLYAHAGMVTANSQGALDSLSTFVPDEKLALVPNPVSYRDDGALPQQPEGPVALAVGRLHQQKAYDILLIAFARFSQNHPEWRLWILGDGALRNELEQLAQSLGLEQKVVWYGHQSNPFPFYRAASLFVMPSRFEGMPNALLEAMNCGVAPIVNDCSPGPLEMVEPEKSGLVAACGDSEALAGALARLAGDEPLRHRLAEGARQRLAAHAEEQVFAQWEQVIGWG